MHTTTLPRHPRTGVLAVGWRKARTGETEGELYPVWPILGAAEDDEEDEDPQEDPDPAGDPEDDDPEDDPEGADDLGDKGKQALDRMKAKFKTERDKRRQAEAERDQLKAGPAEGDAAAIRAEADTAATAKANKRIVRSEVKAAAKGKLANPGDALVFLDLTAFEVDGDGQVDEDEVAEAIETLLTERPYLATPTGKQPRFQGSGDGGARKGTAGPRQLTEQEVKKMTPEQIDEAHRKGQLRDYLGG
ncbi:hypothetical protein ACFO3J_24170 [Streptomyces polygonati]|uniref:EF-hand domain-containing protein n=1 Tax=Streptomyces polygonati TaxID=1617087 RepID=A0ABV8HR94_9ACTN